MTREEFWEIVMKLVRKDYWDAQSVPSKEVKEILTNSLLIPKPKFKVGDKVREIEKPDNIVWFDYIRYDLETSEWVYEEIDYETTNDYYESELELVDIQNENR